MMVITGAAVIGATSAAPAILGAILVACVLGWIGWTNLKDRMQDRRGRQMRREREYSGYRARRFGR